MEPDFKITAEGIVSKTFIEKGITDFVTAAGYIRHLPYRRNANKADILAPLKEECGTCSTKHVLLAALATENNQPDVELKLGIFKIGKTYSAAVGEVLAKYNLLYIPEAHNYLFFDGQRWDYTTAKSAATDFENDLMDEITITPTQLSGFKVPYHKAFIDNWRKETQQPYTLDELWKIREECIAAMASA